MSMEITNRLNKISYVPSKVVSNPERAIFLISREMFKWESWHFNVNFAAHINKARKFKSNAAKFVI